MADRLHLPFFMESRPERPGPAPNEAELRALRLDFFHRLMAFHRTPYLLTAHHRDDALETLLLRLARGGNLDALTAPREIQKFRDGTIHLHPLLGHSKGDLRHYLRERAIPWCEDGTNAENGHTRNRVRNQLIPLWDSFEPRRNLKNSLWRSRQLLLEDGEALAELARATHGAAVDGDRLRIPPLLAVPTAIRRRVIHLYLTAHGRSAGAATVELILRALPLQKKCQITLAKNCRLRSDGHSLCLVSDGENFPA
jgi:tRNA(Ile)-lysidine synthetase-like protein